MAQRASLLLATFGVVSILRLDSSTNGWKGGRLMGSPITAPSCDSIAPPYPLSYRHDACLEQLDSTWVALVGSEALRLQASKNETCRRMGTSLANLLRNHSLHGFSVMVRDEDDTASVYMGFTHEKRERARIAVGHEGHIHFWNGAVPLRTRFPVEILTSAIRHEAAHSIGIGWEPLEPDQAATESARSCREG